MEILTLKCTNCNSVKTVDNFVKNKNNTDRQNRDFWCSVCRKKLVEGEQSLKDYCRENNRCYNQKLFKEALRVSKNKLDKKSEIDKIHNYDELLIQWAINFYFSKMNLDGNEGDKIVKNKLTKKRKPKNNIPEDLINKWGELEDEKEYRIFEDKFQKYCLSFTVENEAQSDYLRKAIAASSKVDKAIAKGDAKEAETWMKVYDTAMKAGKLQPVQMSASDMLSGVVTFSQFFELVEKQGFIPPMPNIIRDDVDYAIWKFINYNRELFNFPPIELGEVKNIMTYDYESGQEILKDKK